VGSCAVFIGGRGIANEKFRCSTLIKSSIKILDRYLAKQIIISILLVALALLGIDIFFSLVHELKLVGKGHYTLKTALSFLVLSLPTRFYILFPWAALIGSLMGLGTLANHSELVVMRTVGVSVFRISIAVLKAAAILIIFVVFLGEGVAPTTERLAQNKKTLALSSGQTIQTFFGLWIRQGREFIHVQSVRPDGALIGVTRYTFDENQKLQEALQAERAVPMGSRWQLQEVRGTRFFVKNTHNFKEATQWVSHLLDPELLETAVSRHPEYLSLPTLWRTIEHRAQNELNTQNYQLAFWTKLVQPLVILMMVFLAVPFVFGPLRSGSQSLRIVMGILVAFLFHTLNHLFAPLAIVYQFSAPVAVLLPILIFTGVGFLILRRIGR
jgi:lipopolysaccharide export system permease protein